MSFNPLLPELSAQTGFALSPLDRMSEIREDKQILADMSAAAGTRYIVIGRDRPILKRVEDGYDPFFTAAEAATVGRQRETVLLGKGTLGPHADVAFYAIVLDDSAVDIVEVADEGGLIDTRKFVVPGRNDLFVHDLRALATEGTLPVDIIGVLGQAKSIMHWHARHRFCSNCGSSSEMAAAGWRRECRSCKAMHFPRTDPVVIMLVTRGNSVLLGRSPGWPEGMFSVLAGFVEPGETLEAAVRREVFEEAGITCGAVGYLASQPWPFPASLMIGMRTEATDSAITLDPAELEAALWVTREELVQVLADRHPAIRPPRRGAIAEFLLSNWLADRLD